MSCISISLGCIVLVVAWHWLYHVAVLAACEERMIVWSRRSSSTDSCWPRLLSIIHHDYSVLSSRLINNGSLMNICFRPDTLSPAVPRQLADGRLGGRAAWTLPGRAASDNAMRRADFGATRVIDHCVGKPAGRALTDGVVSTTFLTSDYRTAGLTSDTHMSLCH